jgi:hypothetical protein
MPWRLTGKKYGFMQQVLALVNLIIVFGEAVKEQEHFP